MTVIAPDFMRTNLALVQPPLRPPSTPLLANPWVRLGGMALAGAAVGGALGFAAGGPSGALLGAAVGGVGTFAGSLAVIALIVRKMS